MTWSGQGALDPSNRVVNGVRTTTGSTTVTHTSSALSTQAVTFPTPFKSAPTVMVASNRTGADFLLSVYGVTTTGFVVASRYLLNTDISTPSPVTWRAEGAA